VFDWNRKGPDGKPRDLHVEESLASIRFDDFEPDLIRTHYSRNPVIKLRYVVDDPLFRVDAYQVKRGQRFYLQLEVTQIIGLLRGRLEISFQGTPLLVRAGQFVMLPAALERVALTAETQVEYLQIQAGVAPG
jgi:mannose-6-phosphate isomerase